MMRANVEQITMTKNMYNKTVLFQRGFLLDELLPSHRRGRDLPSAHCANAFGERAILAVVSGGVVRDVLADAALLELAC